MNKAELIEAVAKSTGETKASTAKIVDAVFETIAASSEVTIYGFGKFEHALRAARKGRNPLTGKEIDIPAKTAFVFKASKSQKK